MGTENTRSKCAEIADQGTAPDDASNHVATERRLGTARSMYKETQ
jgi:hypothetical protein